MSSNIPDNRTAGNTDRSTQAPCPASGYLARQPMNIRGDFEPISTLVHRMGHIGEEFSRYYREYWPRIKTEEGFDALPLTFIELHEKGTNCAESICLPLLGFNWVESYPTCHAWVARVEKLIQLANVDYMMAIRDLSKKDVEYLDNQCRHLGREIIIQFGRMIDLIEVASSTIALIKTSYLYRAEEGEIAVDERNQIIHIGEVASGGKININSTDNSVTNNATSSSAEIFLKLSVAIEKSDIGQIEKDRLIAGINEMQKAQGGSGFIKKYQQFMQDAANHMTILSPFLPQLAGMLG